MSDASSATLMLVLVNVPLLLALALAFRVTRPAALALAPWAALPVLPLTVVTPPAAPVHLPWLLLGSDFGIVDRTGWLFLLFTALLWWLAGLFARTYMANRPRRGLFYLTFLLSMCGNLGLILAQDLASFYVYFALMSFASYGLVVHERSLESLRAGRVYILLAVVGELALFAALVLAANAAGALGFDAVRQALPHAGSRQLIILLALIGFGIKAGLLGLHVWLPLAHPVAPTPASAVLSGAMIKAGLLGWLRLLPLGEALLPHWGTALMLLGLAAAFYGVGIGLTQRSPKTLLAYSSISQMGLMTMAVGMGLSAPQIVPGLLPVIALYALHHGLNKGALFLGVGVLDTVRGHTRRWSWRLLWIPALALSGAPLTSGMLAKLLLKGQTELMPPPWAALLPGLLSASALATALLLGRFLWLTAPPRDEPTPAPGATTLLWPWTLLIGAALIVPWWLAPAWPTFTSPTAIADSAWPLLAAAMLLLASHHLARRRGVPLPSIPAGDILPPLLQLFTPCLNAVRRWCVTQLPHRRDALLGIVNRTWSQLAAERRLGRLEAQIGGWRSALLLFLLVGLLLALSGSRIW